MSTYRRHMSILDRLQESPLPSLNRMVQDRTDAVVEIAALKHDIDRLTETNTQLVALVESAGAKVAWQRRFKRSSDGTWTEWEFSRLSEPEFNYKFGYLIEKGECEVRDLFARTPSIPSTDSGGK